MGLEPRKVAASSFSPTFSEISMIGRMSFFWARGAVRTDLHARGYDFAGERFCVGIGAGAGAGQADIYRVDAEGFHQVQDFDFLLDGGIVDGGILEAVAKGLVVQRDAAARGNFSALGGVPVVDEFFAVQFFRVPWPRR